MTRQQQQGYRSGVEQDATTLLEHVMTQTERMVPGTTLELTPTLSAVVVSDEWVRQRAEREGVVIGRVTVLRVGERTARQSFWYDWSAPDCPLHHVSLEWVC